MHFEQMPLFNMNEGDINVKLTIQVNLAQQARQASWFLRNKPSPCREHAHICEIRRYFTLQRLFGGVSVLIRHALF